MRVIAVAAALVAASGSVIVLYVSTYVTALSCVPDDPCGITSPSVLVQVFAWMGLASLIVVVILLAWHAPVAATVISVLVTAAIYAAWLITFVVGITDTSFSN